ncbi:uncharacterized protein [Littorina saxatilis]|uniref:Galectin n=1 Tax=Littorina saxatilis TaxID=31220 RepID=A0AAN9G7G6_9CAEN
MYDGRGNRPLKLELHFTKNYALFLSYMNGGFTPEHQRVTSPAFPLSESTPFLLELVASSDFVLDIYVNGTFYHSSHTLPASVTTITGVKFSNDVNLHELDLWCQ